MKRCPGCGGEYRAASRTVVLLAASGKGQKNRVARVCPGCHGKGVTVVATFVPSVVKKVEARSGELDKAIRMLTSYLRMAQAITKDPLSETSKLLAEGRAEGLESAIETLQKIQAGEA
jgi:hypothetical protein